MPKTGRDGRAKKSELPSTLQRSGSKAQQTFAETFDSAAEQYGDDGRAYRVAFASVKHTHEKVGDHWDEKDEYGPSDGRAEEGGPDSSTPSAGGVDANATKQHLYELATRLGVERRSRMTKAELVEALQKANDRASAAARR